MIIMAIAVIAIAARPLWSVVERARLVDRIRSQASLVCVPNEQLHLQGEIISVNCCPDASAPLLSSFEGISIGDSIVGSSDLPEWWADLLATDELQYVWISERTVRQPDIEALAHSRQISELHLHDCRLELFGTFSLPEKLQTLWVSNCQTEDVPEFGHAPLLRSCMLAIENLKIGHVHNIIGPEHSLEELSLVYSVEADILDEVATMPNLHSLHLNSSSIPAGWFRTFRSKSILQSLHLRSCKYDSEITELLQEAPNIRFFVAESSHFDDRLCQVLCETASDLEWVMLRNTSISDHSILYLSSLQNLEVCDLVGTAVTVDGVSQLRRKFPNATIMHHSNSPQL